MKIYTKVGDKGETSLFGGKIVGKDNLRVECYGTVDELNSLLGLALTEIKDSKVSELIQAIQNDLFVLGGELATPNEADAENKNLTQINDNNIKLLETKIDYFENKLTPLKQFILPGGSKSASFLHVARSVCRRCERLIVSLSKNDKINKFIIIYLNRLSDLLFVLARFENNVNQIADIPWNAK